MTAEELVRRVELMMVHLDKMRAAQVISRKSYDKAVLELTEWVASKMDLFDEETQETLQ